MFEGLGVHLHELQSSRYLGVGLAVGVGSASLSRGHCRAFHPGTLDLICGFANPQGRSPPHAQDGRYTRELRLMACSRLEFDGKDVLFSDAQSCNGFEIEIAEGSAVDVDCNLSLLGPSPQPPPVGDRRAACQLSCDFNIDGDRLGFQ